ncbi:DNA topoisomerase, partial [Thermoproteota archaeon]
MSILPLSAPYTLVICEKPNAAERIAEALKEKELKLLKYGKVKVFVVINKDKIYVICSAIGHLYTVSDSLQKRYVYPVFDVEWFPLHKVNKTRLDISHRIDIIKKLAKNANNYINACDFDQEGETIGFNILKYACGEKQNLAFRTKFSTLTKKELQTAFRNAGKGLGNGLAKAGRTRHIIDFIFGVNLSRALSESYYLSNTGYKNITIGRVQGPTISFVVNREVDIRTFVPIPFWKLYAKMTKNGSILSLDYETKRIKQQNDVQNIKNKCKKKNGLVTKITKSLYHQMPPIPFNIGDLQKDAYTLFGYSPSQTMRISEKLYLDALISYPRTSSQKLPSSIDYKKILRILQVILGLQL